MKDISLTGKGLTVVVKSKYSPIHNWMTFSAWYSMWKNLPDAEVIIMCERGIYSKQLMSWAQRISVKFFSYCKDKDPVQVATINELITSGNKVMLFEEPCVVAADVFRDGKVVDSKSSETGTFVSYREGCGKFVVSRWIDKLETPFAGASTRLMTPSVTVNEMRVLKLWDKMSLVFDNVCV